jgi:hypothetical protein
VVARRSAGEERDAGQHENPAGHARHPGRAVDAAPVQRADVEGRQDGQHARRDAEQAEEQAGLD